MSELDIAEQRLRMELMEAQMQKIVFDIEAERRNYDQRQRHANRTAILQTIGIIVAAVVVVVGAFVTGHYFRWP